MAVGFVANRTGVLPREGNKFLTNLLIKVIAPCMIFSSITSKELTDDTFAATLYTLLGAALFSVCAAVLGWVLCKYLLRVSPLEDVGVYAFVFASLNSGFMGFPITLALFGQDILYFMVVHNITLTLYLYTLGPIILSMGSQGPQKQERVRPPLGARFPLEYQHDRCVRQHHHAVCRSASACAAL